MSAPSYRRSSLHALQGYHPHARLTIPKKKKIFVMKKNLGYEKKFGV